MAALSGPDGAFLKQAMRKLDIPAVEVEQQGQGDICVWLGGDVPKIRVGQKWLSAGTHERRKRLLHELLHVKGLRHDNAARRAGYYSNPERDRYSRHIYQQMFGKGDSR